MPRDNHDLHGNAPDNCSTALLLIDVINDLEFRGGDKLLRQALPMARRIARLKARAVEAGLPAVYVNDNFGRWQENFPKQVEHCLNHGVRGEPIARLLAPTPNDYFVLKPKHSGFFGTTLEVLLEYLRARTLVLTGLTADICVLFTANDAFLRDFRLFVPRDCVAAMTSEHKRQALSEVKRVLKADTRSSTRLDMSRFGKRGGDT